MSLWQHTSQPSIPISFTSLWPGSVEPEEIHKAGRTSNLIDSEQTEGPRTS